MSEYIDIISQGALTQGTFLYFSAIMIKNSVDRALVIPKCNAKLLRFIFLFLIFLFFFKLLFIGYPCVDYSLKIQPDLYESLSTVK